YRTQGADLHAIDHPSVVFAARFSLAALHLWRPVAELRVDPPDIHVRRLNDVGIRRNQLVLRHHGPPPVTPAGQQCKRYFRFGTGHPLPAGGERSAVSEMPPRAEDGSAPLLCSTGCGLYSNMR